VRGAESATGTQRRVPVPSSPLDLTLTLPLASPEGHYDLKLTSGSETVWSKSAQAHLLKGKTLIQVRRISGKSELVTTTWKFILDRHSPRSAGFNSGCTAQGRGAKASE